MWKLCWRTRAVKQDALVRLAQLEHVAHLARAEPDEIAQRDHRPLVGRQTVDGLEQVLAVDRVPALRLTHRDAA